MYLVWGKEDGEGDGGFYMVVFFEGEEVTGGRWGL